MRNLVDFDKILSETISIGESIRDWKVDDLPISVRLYHALRRMGYETLGELHGKDYGEIYGTYACGRKTILELHSLLKKLQTEDSLSQIQSEISTAKQKHLTDPKQKISLPGDFKTLPVSRFSFSTRLINTLFSLDVVQLGDLENYSLSEIKKNRSCGKKTVEELKNFITNLSDENFVSQNAEDNKFHLENFEIESVAELIDFINIFLEQIDEKPKEILLDRFGGKADESLLTLEEIGSKYKLTRERIRQIESRAIKKLRFQVSEAAVTVLRNLKQTSLAVICPLTPKWLVYLTENKYTLFQYPPAFYVRLIAEVEPSLPVLVEGQNEGRLNKSTKQIIRRIKD